jgi:long-subunit acyl-CoA synthetase (AMP-forming)
VVGVSERDGRGGVVQQERDLVPREIAAAVATANTRLARVEQVKRYAVVWDDWNPGGDEMTPTMKLRRKRIAAKYTASIDALYARA